RRTARLLAALGLLCGLILPGRAGADEVTAIIDKAAKAHFPKGLDTKNQGMRIKSKGTLHIMGQDLPIVQEVTVQMPDKLKEVVEVTVMGNQITVVTAYNGKEAWIRSGDADVPVNDDILAEVKEAIHGMRLMQG